MVRKNTRDKGTSCRAEVLILGSGLLLGLRADGGDQGLCRKRKRSDEFLPERCSPYLGYALQLVRFSAQQAALELLLASPSRRGEGEQVLAGGSASATWCGGRSK
jgi:hypothetical protein